MKETAVTPVLGAPGEHKPLMLLGLLLDGPLHGYELHRIVRAHGELYSDLSKANVYYLLTRLERDRFVRVKVRSGARGSRGERLVYSITDRGRARFDELLRSVLRTFHPAHTGVDVGIVFLSLVERTEAVALLQERRNTVGARRDAAGAELAQFASRGLVAGLAADHVLNLMNAELAWIERAITALQETPPRPTTPTAHDSAEARGGHQTQSKR